MQYEGGYLVETVVQGNEIGVVPYMIRVSDDGELYAVDEVNSNIVKITPPLSQYSRARLVAGLFQGLCGHVDGKPTDACFNHLKGVAMDYTGNVYVAGTLNLAIRKTGDSGVTLVAGGNQMWQGTGMAPVMQLFGSHSTRKIVTISTIRYLPLVDGGQMHPQRQALETLFEDKSSRDEKPIPVMDNSKEFPGWPSFGQLMVDLSKRALEALASLLLFLVPARLRSVGWRKCLAPLKDTLRMPEDEVGSKLAKLQRTPALPSETRQTHPQPEKHSDVKPPKIKSAGFKDPSADSKQKSSRGRGYAEFHRTADVPPYIKSKSHKERVRQRQRDGVTVQSERSRSRRRNLGNIVSLKSTNITTSGTSTVPTNPFGFDLDGDVITF